MIESGGWRCPLCHEPADDPAAHLKTVHGVGGARDRFGLRDAARPPTPPAASPEGSDADADAPVAEGDGNDGTPTGHSAIHGTATRGGGSLGTPAIDEPPDSANGAATNGPRPALPRPRPATRRSLSRKRFPASGEPVVQPARPAPLPADAAVLRLNCEGLDGVDAGRLQQRLAELPGIEAVTIDLYDRTADLFIDRPRAAPPHLVTLAMERIGLAVATAELHRSPRPGEKLGDGTLLFVVA